MRPSSPSVHHHPGSTGIVDAAFTLIELMIVISIVSMLAAMLMPIYGIVRNSTMRTQSEAVLMKTDIGLRQYKTDWGVYPYHLDYPDLSGGGSFTTNRLYYHIGSDISDGDRGNVRADMDTAAAQFAYVGSWPASASAGGAASRYVENTAALSPVAYRVAPSTWCVDSFHAYYQEHHASSAYIPTQCLNVIPAVLNRMAQEQARLAVLSGNLDMRGPMIGKDPASLETDLRNIKVFSAATPTSAGNPGWATDYLHHELERRFFSGSAILDAWGGALVYINQTLPSVRGTNARMFDFQLSQFDSRLMGLGGLGFNPKTGPADAIVSANRRFLLAGRVRLSLADAGDGQPTPADATYFPDASRLRHSDVRYYAAPGFESEFELWSAGRDRQFAYMRDDPRNGDNLAVQPYAKGLP